MVPILRNLKLEPSGRLSQTRSQYQSLHKIEGHMTRKHVAETRGQTRKHVCAHGPLLHVHNYSYTWCARGVVSSWHIKNRMQYTCIYYGTVLHVAVSENRGHSVQNVHSRYKRLQVQRSTRANFRQMYLGIL